MRSSELILFLRDTYTRDATARLGFLRLLARGGGYDTSTRIFIYQIGSAKGNCPYWLDSAPPANETLSGQVLLFRVVTLRRQPYSARLAFGGGLRNMAFFLGFVLEPTSN